VSESELFTALRTNKEDIQGNAFTVFLFFFIRIDFLLVNFLLKSILLKYNTVRIDFHHSIKPGKINFFLVHKSFRIDFGLYIGH